MTQAFLVAALLAAWLATAASAQAPPKSEEKETGLAAVYSQALDGHATASGQPYDPTKLTASHRTLPFGTNIRVTNPTTKQSVVLRVNDRGPKQAGRIVEISQA